MTAPVVKIAPPSQAQAGQAAHRGRAPERGRRIQAAHGQPFTQDDTGAQEADPRGHLGGDARGAVLSIHQGTDEHEAGRPDGHEGVGAKARGPPMPLPLDANDDAQHQRRRDACTQLDGRHASSNPGRPE